MCAALPSHGRTVRQQVTRVRPVMICAARCTSKLAASRRLESIAFLELDVLRTPTLLVRMPLDQALSNVTSAAATVTNVMLVQPFASAVSSC